MEHEITENPLRGVEAKVGSGHYGVFDHGAHVWSWQPDGAAPVIWMSAKSWFSDGQPIRGGVPICFPWFGPGRAGDQLPIHGFARLQQPSQRAEVEIAVAGFPAAERRHAEAAVPDRTGQGDVQQAQIFRQPFRLRQLETGLILAQIQYRRERLAIVVERLVLFTKPGDKRQPDQGVLQPF